MIKTTCYSVTKKELGGMIKGYLNRLNHKYGGITYSPKTDTFRLTDMDGDTTIDDILKDAFGVDNYAGYSTKIMPNMVTVMYHIG